MMVQSSILDTLYNNPLHTHTHQKKKKKSNQPHKNFPNFSTFSNINSPQREKKKKKKKKTKQKNLYQTVFVWLWLSFLSLSKLSLRPLLWFQSLSYILVQNPTFRWPHETPFICWFLLSSALEALISNELLMVLSWWKFHWKSFCLSGVYVCVFCGLCLMLSLIQWDCSGPL